MSLSDKMGLNWVIRVNPTDYTSEFCRQFPLSTLMSAANEIGFNAQEKRHIIRARFRYPFAQS
jgi:hypothetical protein